MNRPYSAQTLSFGNSDDLGLDDLHDVVVRGSL